MVFTLLMTLCLTQVKAQTEIDERAMLNFKKGLSFNAPDSIFGVNLRFRMQNRANFIFDDEAELQNIEARVSRLRLRFDGYVLSSKISYYIQLSFTRGDQDWDNSHLPNIVRDAMVYYRFSPKFYMGFGQGKLPGNRQRIISSGQQQIWDRSSVNSNFTLDRDFGLFAYYSSNISGFYYNLKGAVSTGDGRNQLITDKGLAYTGRIEFLPLGQFKNNGDFSEGDLEFETTPKISIAGGYSVNQNALKTRGTIGTELYESRDLQSVFADVVVKYQGWALSSEYINRNTSQSPFTYNSGDSTQMAWVVTGQGINTQLSYCFPNYWEIAARYSVVKPNDEIKYAALQDSYYILGVNKYVRKHLTKFQGFIGYRDQTSRVPQLTNSSNFLLVFQVELGI